MIDLIAAAGIGGIIGFFTCAILTGGRIADEREARDDWELTAVGLTDDLDDARKNEAAANRIALDALGAHTRCADALTTTQRKLSAIRDIVGPTEGLRRGRMGQIIAVLDGERK